MGNTVSEYLNRPLRSEAEVAAIRDRAEMYERVLGFDEARARWVASRTFDERVGHWFGMYGEGPPDGAPPLESDRRAIASMSLHPNVGAAFWHSEHARLTDLMIVLDELIDEMPGAFWIHLRNTRTNLKSQMACVRALALEMEREADRRAATGVASDAIITTIDALKQDLVNAVNEALR